MAGALSIFLTHRRSGFFRKKIGQKLADRLRPVYFVSGLTSMPLSRCWAFLRSTQVRPVSFLDFFTLEFDLGLLAEWLGMIVGAPGVKVCVGLPI